MEAAQPITYEKPSENFVAENFEVVDSEAGTTETSGWRGTLESISLMQLVLKGIKML